MISPPVNNLSQNASLPVKRMKTMDVTNYYCPKCNKATYNGDDHICKYSGWTVDEYEIIQHLPDGSHIHIADVYDPELMPLLCAAPELLQTLDALVGALYCYGVGKSVDNIMPFVQEARDVIARARGDE